MQKRGGGGICNFACFQCYKITQDLAISLRLIVYIWIKKYYIVQSMYEHLEDNDVSKAIMN